MPLLGSSVQINSQAAKTKSLSLCLGGQLVAMELGQMVACVRSLWFSSPRVEREGRVK